MGDFGEGCGLLWRVEFAGADWRHVRKCWRKWEVETELGMVRQWNRAGKVLVGVGGGDES
jgi:hypothetical protein